MMIYSISGSQEMLFALNGCFQRMCDGGGNMALSRGGIFQHFSPIQPAMATPLNGVPSDMTP